MDDHAFAQSRLEDYLDRSADPAEALIVEAHLAICPGCRADLASVTELRDRARDLPDEIAPPRDLWPAIAARITAGPEMSRTPVVRIDSRSRPQRKPRVWRWAAAAAVVLVAISSGTTAYLLRGGSADGISPMAERAVDAPSHAVGLAAFEPAEAEYRYTVEMMEAELAARRDNLMPETVAAVESNLAIIDEAIAEARAALAADPTSADLPLLLSGVYRQKVELLRSAVDLSARS